MNTEEVRNHDRRFSGDPPRKLTCLAGCHEESGKIQEIPELVGRHTLRSWDGRLTQPVCDATDPTLSDTNAPWRLRRADQVGEDVAARSGD
jgi:hypothetical protein